MTTNGVFTGYALPASPNRGANSITVGADGNLWIGEPGNNSIGRMTTGGLLLGEFPIPTPNAGVGGIARGPDGNVWFTENSANQIAVVTPAGAITEFPIPTANSLPRRPTAGPDGNVWFPENAGNIAKVVQRRQAPSTWRKLAPVGQPSAAPPPPWYTKTSPATMPVVSTRRWSSSASVRR